jgi:hypothetical protein
MAEVAVRSDARRVELAARMNESAGIGELAVGEELAGERRMVEGAVGVGARRVEFAALLRLDDWLGSVRDGNGNGAEH